MQRDHILKNLILIFICGDFWPQEQNLKNIYYLSGALAALLLSGVEPFVQF